MADGDMSKSSLPFLLADLESSLEYVLTSPLENAAVQPPADGISLLDTKNELMLSYVQTLVFFLILKIRQGAIHSGSTNEKDAASLAKLENNALQKLVELRVYLEKGVKVLEGRLKYQITKVIKAADDAAATKEIKSQGSHASKNEDTNEQYESGEDSDASRATISSESNTNNLMYRPNLSAIRRTNEIEQRDETTTQKTGVYQPPKINPTSLPTTDAKEEKTGRKPARSAVLEEFIANEYSATPVAEPYIGGTVTDGGRRSKSARERKEEQERTAYEEANFVRLPSESKKERARKNAQRRNQYGGEEWRDLAEGLDRIGKLTRKRKGGTALERSRKRVR